MRFATVASIATLLAVASAQGGYPACSIPCLASADYGTCSMQDTACLCRSTAFVESTTQCIFESCEGEERETAFAVSRGACEVVGVTLTSTPVQSPTGSETTAGSTQSAGTTSGTGTGSSTRSVSTAPTGTTPSTSQTSPAGTTSNGSPSQTPPPNGAASLAVGTASTLFGLAAFVGLAL